MRKYTTGGKCRHCNHRQRCKPIGLCRQCYENPTIREIVRQLWEHRVIATSWTLTVDGFSPPKINDWRGRSWRKRARAVRVMADLFTVYARILRVPTVRESAPAKRRIGLELHGWPTGKLPDPDGFHKDLLDALKTARLIFDDSQDWVEWSMPTLVRDRERKTVITIEDML